MERSVLTLSLAISRTTAPVRAVGVDQAGQRLYLGLEDGVLEEYAVLQQGSRGVQASLSARKHVCRKVRLSWRRAL